MTHRAETHRAETQGDETRGAEGEAQGPFSLRGKVVLVTGGSRGLGKEMALALAEAGASVAITARREQWLIPAAEEIRVASQAAGGAGQDCLAGVCDVTDAPAVERFVGEVLARLGRIDVLFNNAGVSWGAPSAKMPLERWRDVLEVNATGTFVVTQAVGRHMLSRAGETAPGGNTGKIVNVTSIMGLRGTPPEVLSAAGYSASKGALVALTRALAVEWAPQGITVNALAPGFFPTRLSEGVIGRHEGQLVARIPLGRLGRGADLRGVAVFLAAPASDYITGQVLALDGGATAL